MAHRESLISGLTLEYKNDLRLVTEKLNASATVFARLLADNNLHESDVVLKKASMSPFSSSKIQKVVTFLQ